MLLKTKFCFTHKICDKIINFHTKWTFLKSLPNIKILEKKFHK